MTLKKEKEQLDTHVEILEDQFANLETGKETKKADLVASGVERDSSTNALGFKDAEMEGF